MNVLKRTALAIVGASAPRADRALLKAANAGVQQVEQAVIDARETRDRYKAEVALKDETARAAADAVRAVTELEEAWVASGCRYSAARELEAAREAAREKSQAAQAAASNAKAVGPALARAESLLRDAESAKRAAEGPINHALAAILVDENRAKLDRLAAILVELPEAWADVVAIEQFIDPWSNDNGVRAESETYRKVARAREEAATVFQSLLKEIDGYSKHPLYERVIQRKVHLRERVAQLRGDPES